jgi:SAM-dependent methyltransferase
MVDGADAGGWSDVADGWASMWGGFARPAQRVLMDAAAITPGTAVVDVGCGGGEFLALLRDAGARAVGVDPADGMRRVATAAGFDVRAGDAEHLPFDAGAFEVATAVNALQFADDTTAALRELARVVVADGRVAIANWADAAHNDLDVIEHAVALADDTEPHPDGPLRIEGGLESALAAAGLGVSASGLVDVPWAAADEEALVRGVLLGETEEFIAEMRPVVREAAAPFRVGEGYVLHNRFRWVVGAVR